ncbi:MAG: copper-binding protein [Steroidobacteraceae bacterium]
MTALITASLAAVTAVAADPPNSMNMPGMQMPGAASAQRKLGQTTGKVVQIDQAHSRITIAHHPVPALGWPAMTMTFQATTQQLKGIKVGDHVDFQFYMHDHAAVIDRIHKIG